MGSRNLDRIDIIDHRPRVETVADMQREGWRVVSQCRTCRLQMPVDLKVVALVKGRRFSLWNATARCKRLVSPTMRCSGVVDFLARTPGRHDFQPIAGPATPPPRDPHWIRYGR